ncbi:ATPase [Aureococcus anophagefferens]|nr:ATPase [Aureococcus anophagefferens]
MSVFNKRKEKDVDIEKLWAEKMRKNPSLKRLNPPGSAADIMQAIEYDWDLHIKNKQKADREGPDDPNWHKMFMTESEDDTPLKEMVTQTYPYLKREMVRTKKKKGEAFVELLVKYQDLMVPEDNKKYRDAAYRIEKEYNARGGCGPSRRARDHGPQDLPPDPRGGQGASGSDYRTANAEDQCWLKCNITEPEPGRDYSIILRDDFGSSGGNGAAEPNGTNGADDEDATVAPAEDAPAEDAPADATSTRPPQTRPLVSLHSETIRVAGRPLIEDLTLTIAAGDRWALRAIEFAESRFSSVHKRATVASYLFPERYPSAKRVGYERGGPRLAPTARAQPAGEPALAGLEAAAAGAGAVLGRFGLDGLHHQPLFALSTGEARKLLVADYFLPDAARRSSYWTRPSTAWTRRRGRARGRARRRGADDRQVAHRLEGVEAVAPTKAVVLRGDGSAAVGDWDAVRGEALAVLEREGDAVTTAPPPRPDPKSVGAARKSWGRRRRVRRAVSAGRALRRRLRRLRRPPRLPRRPLVLPARGRVGRGDGPLGKPSAFVDLIRGRQRLGFRQNLTLFGRRKGSGESVWDVKRQIGLLSPRSHEDYLAYADPSGGRGLGRSGAGVSSRDVVLSGFYDSVGLYDAPAPGHAAVADAWVDRLGIGDLVLREPGSGRLSLGQQKRAPRARARQKPAAPRAGRPTHARRA